MKIAVVGATGEVGRMMLKILEQEKVPVSELSLFASASSKGKTLQFADKQIEVQELTEDAMWQKYDYVLFSAGSGIAWEYAPIAAEAGSVVIDNSSAFRKDDEIPLVVPEVNGDQLQGYRGIIANPNCSTIQMVLALYPLHQRYNLKTIVVSTYQAVSGAGNKGVTELFNQRNGNTEVKHFSKPIDLNIIPEIGEITDSGYSTEEIKMHNESAIIMQIDNLNISATTVRVPVKYGHSESIFAEFEQDIELMEAMDLLSGSESVKYEHNTTTPLEIEDSDQSHVCRLRYGYNKNTLAFWNVANNVRVGAATNAVRILIKHKELSN